MPGLIQIGFTNSVRFFDRVQYFEFEGVRFKLIQNDPTRFCDVLLSLVETADDDSIQRVYGAAGKFAAALCWELQFANWLTPLGVAGVPCGFTLRGARCNMFSFPQIPHRGQHIGSSLSRIARIINHQQHRALTLYREGLASNNVLLSLLLHWQVLDVRPGDPVAWVDQTLRNRPNEVRLDQRDLAELNLNGRSLGEYLRDDCRHAIAHIRRTEGRREIQFDYRADDLRLRVSAKVMRQLACTFIRSGLLVDESLYLVRKGGRRFPEYLDQEAIAGGSYTTVRPKRTGLLEPPIYRDQPPRR